MTIAKSVFYLSAAWVGRIDGETRCSFWPTNPLENHFDPALLVPVDLSKTPSVALKGQISWDQVQVDDFADHHGGGLTLIGPLFPDGRMVGGVYLERKYWSRLRKEIRPAFPPPGFEMPEKYQYMAVVYQDGSRAGRRYMGLHAKIIREEGSTAVITILNECDPEFAETSSPTSGLELKCDLSSLDCDAHVDAGGMTEIATGKGKRKEGALFLDAKYAKRIGLPVPVKCPPSKGIVVPTLSSRGRPRSKARAGAGVSLTGRKTPLRRQRNRAG